jgi:hypothetical protein
MNLENKVARNDEEKTKVKKEDNMKEE